MTYWIYSNSFDHRSTFSMQVYQKFLIKQTIQQPAQLFGIFPQCVHTQKADKWPVLSFGNVSGIFHTLKCHITLPKLTSKANWDWFYTKIYKSGSTKCPEKYLDRFRFPDELIIYPEHTCIHDWGVSKVHKGLGMHPSVSNVSNSFYLRCDEKMFIHFLFNYNGKWNIMKLKSFWRQKTLSKDKWQYTE